MLTWTRETLLSLGFVDVGFWRASKENIDYELDGEHARANQVLLDGPNALYAFVLGENVKYIGKTTRSVRKRFIGYKTPGKRQPTNLRCNRNIRGAINVPAEIRILVFAPISSLRYLDFEINLAAGLEDSLIKEFNPPWNGREKGKPISEEAEREEAEEKADTAAVPIGGAEEVVRPQTGAQPLAIFTITLGTAYYDQGLVNPGVDASRLLGADGEPVEVMFDDGTDPVVSVINRRANPNGTVRIVGHNRQIADWFRRHFQRGDLVKAQVLGANHILLMAPKVNIRNAERS